MRFSTYGETIKCTYLRFIGYRFFTISGLAIAITILFIVSFSSPIQAQYFPKTPAQGITEEKDLWDKIGVISSALIPVIIVAGTYYLNRRLRRTEDSRRESELATRQLETLDKFYTRLTSEKEHEKAASISLINAVDHDLASKVSGWLFRIMAEDEDRRSLYTVMSYGDSDLNNLLRKAFLKHLDDLRDDEVSLRVTIWYMSQLDIRRDTQALQALMNHEKHRIADLAKRAYWQIFLPPPVIEPKPPVQELKSENWRKTTGDLHRPEIPIIYEDNPEEKHGPFVVTRGHHTLRLPDKFRMGLYLVTNESFLEFVQDGGYTTDSFWINMQHRKRENFLCQDGKTKGPSTWPSEHNCFQGQERHPVSGICYYEALAFCQWLDKQYEEKGWRWCLPTEDMWEFTARTKDGRLYPWGDEFEEDHCNSSESKIGTTTPVNHFPKEKNSNNCSDMAGNVWEFVDADDVGQWSCVLRGGSFRNNKEEIMSYLRLYRVPRDHRPPDFGFRCGQRSESNESSQRIM